MSSILERRLPALDDVEGARVPPGLPPILDAHVHVFPGRLFEAVWDWFDRHGWPIRYRLPAGATLRFLLDRGVSRLLALPYAHKPGLARDLNAFVAGLCREEPRVVGGATVLPGESGAEAILEEGFAMGLAAVKIHCHVQCVAPDDPAMDAVYSACSEAGRPLVMHAGREPRSPAYRCDTHSVCGAGRVEAVLRRFPRLTLVIPHLGVDEEAAYLALLSRYPNLYLDTTMMLAGYFPGPEPDLHAYPADRLLYGTDFPNLPYAWDRELRALVAAGLREDDLARVLGGNAARLLGVSL